MPLTAVLLEESVPMYAALLAVAVVGLLATLLGRYSSSGRIREMREQNIRLQTRLDEEQRQTVEKIELLNQSREELRQQFRMLATDVLNEKSRRLSDHNQATISQILQPLQEKISGFEKRVEEAYNREARERFALEKEIRQLHQLNTQISEDAVNLTRALRGEQKTQGVWGEFILSSVLQASGLVEGREYQIQQSFHDTSEDTGSRLRSQPDVVVQLPDNRQIIIDAKVSLTAYERFCSADDDPARDLALKQHVQSVRTHVRQLSDKRYQNLPGVVSLDFVLLFMPVEPAFSLALQQDHELFNHAFDRNIVLVSPSTLLATLRTIQNIWRYEYQSRNAQEIARQAGALYDKFVGFVEDIDDLGRKLDASQRSYEGVINKLQTGKGNLIGRTEKLKKLGARASKKLNEDRLAQDNDDE
ncbi:DNA recombination protein RmuC [Pseudohongiella spirulinae]|uniref:Recombinase RmuC n=1 Tax=Pseudohongiella spirulinae TaxID=1249552 RepID=A0A0S2KE09_9GAMM|nr:DNA recombination protein RmuC [Pseudohongiella spirulinae]ALO46556.1 recombinase RmuC [Pseudohongiella spirulinae]